MKHNHDKFSILDKTFTLIIFFCLLCLIFASCSKVHYVPVEWTKTDTLYKSVTKVDSFTRYDSVYLYLKEKGDTVYSEKVVLKYRNKVVEVHDTIHESRTDSIPVPYPVEKNLSTWQKTKMNFGGFALFILSIVTIIAIIQGFRKNRNVL